MGKTITIEKELLEVWDKEVKVTINNAKACKVAYNTLKNALGTGICTTSTRNKINKFLLRQRELNKKIIGL